MGEPLSIALVCPRAFPPRDDLAWRVEQEAGALAERGHRVSVLAPATTAERVRSGRALLDRVARGEAEAILAAPGTPLAVATGRAFPTGSRHIGGPRDVAASLETALSLTPFDVVHVHEPLAPSPAFAALRHARRITAATFHRPEQLAGVAFVRPLVDRALARVDVRMAVSETARRVLADLLPGDYTVVAPGVDRERFAARPAPSGGPPGLVVIARSRDRAGLRFALRVIRALDLSSVGPIAILGPVEAPWRTRAAVPKALRDGVVTLPDSGPDARREAFSRASLALVAAPEDLDGSAVREAMASGLAVLAPRCAEVDDVLEHGREGLVLPPFSRDVWAEAVAALAADPARHQSLAAQAVRRGGERTWSDVAEEVEELYRAATPRTRAVRAPRPAQERILADLHVCPSPLLSPRELVEACLSRGIGAIAVVGPAGIDDALEARELAPPELTVIVGQELATSEGTLLGLFLERPVAPGRTIAQLIADVHGQGGLIVVPSPGLATPPAPDLLRRHRQSIDCVEAIGGGATLGNAAREGAARLLQRMGTPATAGSGAESAEELGGAYVAMRRFEGPADFLAALLEGEPVQRRRGLRGRPRGQRGPRRQ